MHPIEILEIYRARELAKTDGAVPPLFPPDMFRSTMTRQTFMRSKPSYNETIKKHIRMLAKNQEREQQLQLQLQLQQHQKQS